MNPAAVLLLLAPGAAWAGDLHLGGKLQNLDLAVFPYDSVLMPEDPVAEGLLIQRTNLDITASPALRFQAAHVLDITWASGDFPDFLSGQAADTPEFVKLSWTGLDQGFDVSGRLDRLAVAARLPHVDLTLGRQAISMGRAWFFTPLDLVSPFAPTTVDREYKPGVDALRADAYLGVSTSFTLVAAWLGDPLGSDDSGTGDLVLAARGGATLGITDLGLFLGSVAGDRVMGADLASSLGAWGLYAEATGTLPAQDGTDPFLRAVLGATRHFAADIDFMAEAYVQTIGAADPQDYLSLYSDPRVERGEIWALGRYYGAVSLAWAATPILSLAGFAVANLADPSALLGPAFSWSVADNADLDLGAYLGTGQRPPDLTMDELLQAGVTSEDDILTAIAPRSEFGMYPAMAFLELRAYF